MAQKILIADDDQIVHEALGIYLKAEGFETVDAYDGEEALAAITCNPAKICGIDDRVGSLEMGKDADFVVFRESPLSLSAKPEMVYISGQRVR